MKIQKVKLSVLRQSLRRPIDLFICSSSFEPRCHSVSDTLEKTDIRSVIILEALDLRRYTEKAAHRMRAQFAERGKIVGVSTSDPLLTADNLSKALLTALRQNRPREIVIDVTTFTHEIMLILLVLLRTHHFLLEGTRITLTYSGASEYSVGDSVKNKWLSKGVRGVRSVLGFPGDSLPTKKTHLIILVGYEYERAEKLIEVIEPNSISLGFGRSSTATTEKDKSANAHYHLLLRRMAASYATVESFEIFCNNPVQTRDAILKIVNTHQDSNVLLAPMNNKMSTLGAALAAFGDDKIQVCYAPVLEYNFFHYAKPGKTCYVVELPELLSASRAFSAAAHAV